MRFVVVAVCSANTCRSPLMAAALERGFLAAGLGPEVMVLSAGIHAVPGQRTCASTLAYARTHQLPFLGLEQHQTRLVSDAMVAEADLVLTADRHLRSLVIRRSGTSAGDRVFTLREAAELAAEVVGDVHASSTIGRLRAVTEAMHRTRGFTDLPRTERVLTAFRPWRPLVLHAHDVPDAHQAPVASHRFVHKLVLESVDRLVSAMAGVVQRAEP